MDAAVDRSATGWGCSRCGSPPRGFDSYAPRGRGPPPARLACEPGSLGGVDELPRCHREHVTCPLPALRPPPAFRLTDRRRTGRWDTPAPAAPTTSRARRLNPRAAQCWVEVSVVGGRWHARNCTPRQCTKRSSVPGIPRMRRAAIGLGRDAPAPQRRPKLLIPLR